MNVFGQIAIERLCIDLVKKFGFMVPFKRKGLAAAVANPIDASLPTGSQEMCIRDRR